MPTTTDLGLQYPLATDPYNVPGDLQNLATSIKTGGGIMAPQTRSSFASGATTSSLTNLWDTTTPLRARVTYINYSASATNRAYSFSLLNSTTAQSIQQSYSYVGNANATVVGIANATQTGTTVPFAQTNTHNAVVLDLSLYRDAAGFWFWSGTLHQTHATAATTGYNHLFSGYSVAALTNINGFSLTANTALTAAGRITVERVYLG